MGVRTDAVAAAATFFEALGLIRVLDEPDFVVLDAPNGDRFELFGRAGPQPAHQFARNPIVVGFTVADIEAESARLVAAGAELLGTVERGSDGSAWRHFRAPDRHVYELTQHAEAAG